jgi:hypothetical protein
MRRLAWDTVANAAWGLGGVAAAIVLLEILAPLSVTALFRTLLAAGGYAVLTELGARRTRIVPPGGLAQAVATGGVQFLGVWGLLALAGPLAARADAFLATVQFRSYAAVALGGAFAVSLLLRLVEQRRPDLPGRLLVQGMTFWVSPFFGFFSPAVFAAMSITGFGGTPTGLAGFGVAAGMAAAAFAGRLLADWLSDVR